MVEFNWSDPDAERIHQGLMLVLDAVNEHHLVLRAVYEEVSRQLPPSPVPALLADIIARLERIEARLA